MNLWHRISPFLKYSILSSLLGTLAVASLYKLGELEPFELQIYDRLISLQNYRDPDPRLLVIEITEADIRAQQDWPLSDAVIAKLLSKLQQYQPEVIGLDIYRDIPHSPGTQQLREQLQKPNVIAIQKIGSGNDDHVPPPAGMSTTQIGFNDFVMDPDGVIRRNLLFAAVGEQRFYSFSLLLSLKYLQIQPDELTVNYDYLKIKDSFFWPLGKNSGGYQDIDSSGYQAMVQYRGSHHGAETLTLTHVLENPLSPELVKNKIVLIGTTAPSVKDIFLTPFSSQLDQSHLMPGVSIHAHMTSQILSQVLDNQRGIWYLPQPIEFFWIWLCSAAGGMLGWRLKSPLLIGLSALSGLIVIAGTTAILFLLSGWVPLVAPSVAFFLAGTISTINKKLYDDKYDELTGLPTPKLFEKITSKELSTMRELSEERYLAVVYLDIDKFRLLNESLGHVYGNQVLLEFSRRLTSIFQGGDSHVARIGGDEFAILLSNLSSISDAKNSIDYLQSRISLPFQHTNSDIYVETQLGVAFCGNQYLVSSQNLLQNAHTAMYRAKNSRLKHYEIFSNAMQSLDTDRFWLESYLRTAVKSDQFFVEYQPIVSIKDQKVIGFEALARWHHPEHGRISPAKFIPIAEETGLIITLGEKILSDACQQLHTWHQFFPHHPDLFISVNLSLYQLEQEDLVLKIQNLLQKSGILGAHLKLEVTESVAMSNVEKMIEKLLALKDLDLKIGIDDFGTGYSSLSYLHRLPADTLKIDKSFISNIEYATENMEIVRTIISLGSNLGMKLIAEGIETEKQLSLLKRLDCDYGQGYLFSKPIAATAATELLQMTLSSQVSI